MSVLLPPGARPPTALRLTVSRLDSRLIAPRRNWAIRSVYAARLERIGQRVDPILPHDVYLTRSS